MPKVSNVTNSNDPQLINSRVFVGNLNTFVVSKEDVERIFKRYGRIYGISMHKGYTFVQFCNEYDARNAVAGEEGRIVAGQPLDVNMASEPKPNRPSRSAGTTAASTGDWDFYYEGGYSNAPQAMHGPPVKRARSGVVRRELVTVRPRGKSGQAVQKQPLNITGDFIEYNVSDVVICGNCKEQFADLQGMLTHRKSRCKMRFACKCQDVAEKAGPFHCVSCSEFFVNLRDAVFHAQSIHDIKVVVEELSKEKKEAEKQDNDIGESAGNHEGEASSDSHNILETGDGNDGEGEMENDRDGVDEDAILQDDAEGGEAAE